MGAVARTSSGRLLCRAGVRGAGAECLTGMVPLWTGSPRSARLLHHLSVILALRDLRAERQAALAQGLFLPLRRGAAAALGADAAAELLGRSAADLLLGGCRRRLCGESRCPA